MYRRVTVISALAIFIPTLVFAQTEQPVNQHGPQPIYRVTIVSRTTKAINYGHHSIPTKIDFRGTPIMPDARGDATVENKGGNTLVDAHFNHVPPPTRLGAQYLTYVVWAISPEGRAQNLGELVLNGSDKGKLLATTNMQTFALIVTAEPYYSVPQPSDVVVMENAVRPDTVGKVEEVDATYELLPRKEYTYNTNAPAAPSSGKPVSMREYEAILALRQAQNAVNLAISQGARQYASDYVARSQALIDSARTYPKDQTDEMTSMAREATQLAEDARAIAAKRTQDAQAAAQRDQMNTSRREIETAQARAAEDAERARMEADRAAAEQAAADAAARQQAQAEAFAQQQSIAPRQAPYPPNTPSNANPEIARQTRMRVIASLSGYLPTRDTPRGIVITIPDSMLNGSGLRSELARVASVVRAYPRLRLDVDGYTDGPGDAEYGVTQRRAELVRAVLVADGVPYSIVTARGLGNSRLIDSNATPSGRAMNRRVEIVITGDDIGRVPTWDRTYSLAPR